MAFIDQTNGRIHLSENISVVYGMTKEHVIELCQENGTGALSKWREPRRSLVFRKVPANGGSLYVKIAFGDNDCLRDVYMYVETLNGERSFDIPHEKQVTFFSMLLGTDFFETAQKGKNGLIFSWGGIFFEPDQDENILWIVVRYRGAYA